MELFWHFSRTKWYIFIYWIYLFIYLLLFCGIRFRGCQMVLDCGCSLIYRSYVKSHSNPQSVEIYEWAETTGVCSFMGIMFAYVTFVLFSLLWKQSELQFQLRLIQTISCMKEVDWGTQRFVENHLKSQVQLFDHHHLVFHGEGVGELQNQTKTQRKHGALLKRI